MTRFLTLLAAVLIAVTPAAGTGQIATQTFEEGSWSRIIAKEHSGPVIVHVWGLTCPSCLAELPSWGELAAAHPNARFVLINWDKHAYNPARVADALRKSRLDGIENWVFREGYEEKLRYAIDPEWHGEMPYTQLRSAGGTVRTFTGKADFTDLASWIKNQGS